MTMKMVLASFAMFATMPAQAIETTLQLQLSTDQDFERRTIAYDCGGETLLTVNYINAAPNFLAIVPVEEEAQPLVFAAVFSASGARYAASHWVWENKGPDASLFDLTQGSDAEAVLTCSEIVNTP